MLCGQSEIALPTTSRKTLIGCELDRWFKNTSAFDKILLHYLVALFEEVLVITNFSNVAVFYSG